MRYVQIIGSKRYAYQTKLYKNLKQMAEIENLKNFDFYQFFKIKIFYENKNPGTQNDSFLTLKTMEILIFSNLYYNFLVSFDTHMSSLPVIFKSRIWIIQKMFFQISVLNFVFFAQNYYVLPEKFSVIMCWQLFILPTKLFRGYLRSAKTKPKDNSRNQSWG